MRRHPDDFWRDIEKLPATVDGRRFQRTVEEVEVKLAKDLDLPPDQRVVWQAHPMQPIDSDDPEQFYDYIAEWRAAQRRRQYVLTILAGAVIGLIIGLGLWIFAVVQ